MRRIMCILSLIVMTASLVLAEGQGKASPGKSGDAHSNSGKKDDHDDNAPIQSGYAVVTPVGATSSGLVVFETFGMRQNGADDATQAGVLPPDLTNSAAMFVDSNGRLSKNVGVAIVNPNTSNVNVTLTLRSSGGIQIATS